MTLEQADRMIALLERIATAVEKYVKWRMRGSHDRGASGPAKSAG